MAQRIKTTSTAKTPVGTARRGRPPGSRSTKPASASRVVKTRQPAPAKPATTRSKPAAASSVPKISKDELRAQVEKLERTVATLRARSRDAVRAAKQSSARIEELEAQLARKEQLSKPVATAPRAATRTPKPAAEAGMQPMLPDASHARSGKSRRGQTLSDERDPGDAVPPGVAVQDPEPMDEEAAAAFENLQAQLRPAEEMP